MGRPRLKGERLPNLSIVAEDPSTDWTPIKVVNWYGREQRTVEVFSATAVCYSSGLPVVPLRWVLIRDPEGEFDTQALLCTDLSVEPAQIISWFVRRWQMEATFQEMRQRLGFETQRHWSEKAIRRDRSGAVGPVLPGYPVRSPADGARLGHRSPNGMVPQELSDFLRCFSAGAQGVVGTGGDFLRVSAADRYSKSPAGIHGKANRRGLLCSVNGQSRAYMALKPLTMVSSTR